MADPTHLFPPPTRHSTVNDVNWVRTTSRGSTEVVDFVITDDGQQVELAAGITRKATSVTLRSFFFVDVTGISTDSNSNELRNPTSLLKLMKALLGRIFNEIWAMVGKKRHRQ